MAERVQDEPRHAPRRQEVTSPPQDRAAVARVVAKGEELKRRMDDVVEVIDEVLEEVLGDTKDDQEQEAQAGEFVRNYQQRGGE